MERFYVRLYYLKILHYFFFSLGVLSLSVAIILFDVYSLSSRSMIVLSITYTASSLYIANIFMGQFSRMEKNRRELTKQGVKYIFLALYTISLLVIFLNIFPHVVELVYYFIFVNYYIFFLIIIGFLLGRFEIVSKIFEVYSGTMLQRAKSFALEYSKYRGLHDYKIGSDETVDEMLETIWSNKTYPLPFVKDLEVYICEKKIKDIDNAIRNFSGRGMNQLVKVLESEKKQEEKTLFTLSSKQI
ncbi:MAG: hypothetical protein JW754_00340 [Candidatus Aenigmarchaeota archaeon]|nr:hypothetical protein [Candidatus Aenigmarchaeota archaeon]